MSTTEDEERERYRQERIEECRSRLEKLDASERLMATFSDADSEGLLDEEVHDCKGAEAADINNGGLQSQVDYLLDAGYTEEQLREKLGG